MTPAAFPSYYTCTSSPQRAQIHLRRIRQFRRIRRSGRQ